MKKSKRFLYITTIVSFLCNILIYHRLPSIVPIHFNASWEVDGYAPKYYVLLAAILPFILCVFMDVLPKIDPKRRKQEQENTYIIMQYLIVLLLLCMNWLTILLALKVLSHINIVMQLILGIIFILLGNYMPKIRPNYFLGIKNPWTLTNDVVWRKTHRFGGYIFIVFGVICILSSLIENKYNGVIMIITMSLGLIILYIYSYKVYRNIMKDKS